MQYILLLALLAQTLPGMPPVIDPRNVYSESTAGKLSKSRTQQGFRDAATTVGWKHREVVNITLSHRCQPIAELGEYSFHKLCLFICISKCL